VALPAHRGTDRAVLGAVGDHGRSGRSFNGDAPGEVLSDAGISAVERAPALKQDLFISVLPADCQYRKIRDARARRLLHHAAP
jgi:hypothetical protein